CESLDRERLGSDYRVCAAAARPRRPRARRLDVRDDLDGIKEGLWALERLVDCGVSILNRPPSLLRAHDKLLTARTLRRAGLPHPRTTLIDAGQTLPDLDFPAVLKPRFGSWGKDVLLCRDRDELGRGLASLSSGPSFTP